MCQEFRKEIHSWPSGEVTKEQIEELLYYPCWIAHRVMSDMISEEEVSDLAEGIRVYVQKRIDSEVERKLMGKRNG